MDNRIYIIFERLEEHKTHLRKSIIMITSLISEALFIVGKKIET